MSCNILVLVGGPSKGTRFRPLSLETPKPLYPIAGKSNLDHMLESAKELSGLKQVFLLGFYPETAFSDYCTSASQDLGVSVSYIAEVDGLGTAGGIHQNAELLWKDAENLIVLHSDICCSFPLKEVLQFHVDEKRPATIMGVEVPKEDSSYYGCLIEEEGTHQLLHYAEKPETYVSRLINGGIYVLSSGFKDDIESAYAMVAKREANYTGETDMSLSLERDVIFENVGKEKIYVYRYQESFWRQIKHAGAALFCNDMYTSYWQRVKPDRLAKGDNIFGNVVLHPSAKVDPSAKLGPNVYIGEGSVVGAGARIRNTIVGVNCTVKDHALVVYAILANDCSIGMWARVEGILNSTPHHLVGNIRVGATILASDVTVNPEKHVYNCIVMPHKGIGEDTRNEIVL